MGKKLWIAVLGFGILSQGCAKRILIPYEDVQKTNHARLSLTSGKTVEGSVVQVEPHQVILLVKGKVQKIPKSSIRSVRINPPVLDDFNQGISEEEIASVKKGKYGVVYGIGGGVLSFGIGFFAGSMIGNSMGENGGTVLTAVTAGGGILGTLLFVRAGKAKDRNEAIEIIREKRRSQEMKSVGTKSRSQDELERMLEEEKQRQESLRQERERLLKEIEKKKD